MTAVFAVFVLTGVPSIEEIGPGSAIAIALDATLASACAEAGYTGCSRQR